MDRARVPEAPVDEDSDVSATEHHARPPARQSWQRRIHPVAEAPTVRLPSNRHLGGGVAPAGTTHPCRHFWARCRRASRHPLSLPHTSTCLAMITVAPPPPPPHSRNRAGTNPPCARLNAPSPRAR